MKPKIKDASFGSITVGKKTYSHDVVIGLDGEVRKRNKKLSKHRFGTSHKVSLEEIKDIHQQGARQLIVGTGHYNQVRFSQEAAAYLAAENCTATLLPTPKASKLWNNTKSKHETIGMFHITC